MFLGSHLGHPSWFLAIFKLALTGPFWIVVSGAFALFLAFAGFFFLAPFFLPFGAMSRLFRRTFVLDVSGFPDDCNVNYIAEKICGSFNVGDVVSIQFMPGKSVRVSFKDESIKTTVLSSDSFVVDGVACHVRGGGPRPENVLVFRYPFEGDHSTGEAASVASATPLGSLPSWGSAADLSDGELPPSSVVDDLVREAGLGSDHIFSPLSDIEVSGELDSSDDATDDNGIVKRSDGIKVQSSASIGNESNGIIVKGSNGREVQSSASSCNETNGIIIKGSNGMELQSSASTLNENRNNIEKPLSGDNATDKNSNNTVKVPQNVKAAINNNSVSGSNDDGSSCGSLSSQPAPPSEVEMVEASPARKRGLPPAETSSDSSSAPSPRKKQAKAAKKSGTVPPPRKASSSGAKLGSLSPASTSRRNQRS